jgi:hypothetical protein
MSTKEQIKKWNKKYRDSHKKQISDYFKKYYIEHKKEINNRSNNQYHKMRQIYKEYLNEIGVE